MALTLEEGKTLIERIMTTKEQWNIEEPVKYTGKVYHVEDMEEFKKVTQEKGKPVEQVIHEKVDLFSIYQQEDELRETMNRFKHHQEDFNRDLRRCIHHNEKVISYLSEEVDGLSHAVKNLDKHSRMIETQCSQISETQSLILAQLDKDNLVSSNWIGTRSGKMTQDPKGPEWYEREQALKRKKVRVKPRR